MALSENTRGALLMAISMAGFTFNDALTKSVTAELTVAQIMFVRGAFTAMLVYAVARHMGALDHIRNILQPLILIRIAFETVAAVAFLAALGQVPLANASAILQSLPLAVTLGAALFYKEPVGWRRWTAIGLGFIGVIVIIQPGPEGFTLASLYIVLCVVTAAGRDLVTRRIDPGISSLTVTLFTAASISFAGLLLVPAFGGWQPISGSALGRLAFASVFLFAGYQAIIMAMRTGEISFIAPFRYTSLLWAVLLGMVFFDEVPDVWMIVGAAIVIGSGLYTFYRESKRKAALARRADPASPG
ncbi:drug/metabolite transporter (DMT)-like permease [Peteryoungia aggregata LMG 23059]|uniref:Drug/metabolite transporter (DMT)-like permease n=1 Tax=Peteryoungia aggregata LMG 23059 TaxID=1368425 RepID=A0ABU0G8I7_9HYPH|nr:DMT family transporter [Peteryoungia aggregata]MDQ0421418.1 drug/metabolite transporter (DMT)-like permease [Peteryoungia aggregata LMG 23059]